MKRTKIEAIVNAWIARENCRKNGNDQWFNQWDRKITKYAGEIPLSHTDLVEVSVKEVALIISHYTVGEHGYFLGYTDLEVTLAPTFMGLELSTKVVSCPADLDSCDLDMIVEYIEEVLYHYFEEEE